MIVAVAMVLATAAVPPEKPGACQEDNRIALALDEESFDQGPDGWRRLANDPRCFTAAADLIEQYRAGHRSHGRMLYWHEGQMRAAAGQSKQAIPLFVAARAGGNEWNVDSGWNRYVDASVAFLHRDLTALQHARSALASLPPPAEQPQASPAARAQPRPADWPPNLDVIDGLIRCFDRPYAEAVNPSCRVPANVQP